MKKTLVIILAAIGVAVVAFVSFIVIVQAKTPTTPLLPEVAAIVLHAERPDEAALKRDVYVGLLAIEAPEGADYMAAGSQIVLNNFDSMQKAVEARDLERMKVSGLETYFEKESWLKIDPKERGRDFFICADIYAYQCATDTLNKKDLLAAAVGNNSTLLNRYLKIAQMPNYGTYYYGIADPMPPYQYAQNLGYMRLAQALIAFDAGDVDQGFALLQAEVAFTKRMLAEDENMIGQMIAIRKLYTTYHSISVAMDMPQLRAHIQDERWATLLAPLTLAEQKGMVQAFVTERNMGLYLYYTLSDKDAGLTRVSDGEVTPATEAQKKTFNQTYDRFETSNINYLIFEPLVHRASLPLEEVSRLAQQGQLKSVGEEAQDILNAQLALSKQKGVFHNAIGRVLLEFALPNWQDYLNRRYDVQAYGVLVNAKRLMIQGSVSADQVEAFLKNGGMQTRNPYTQEIFVWDAPTQTLSTPWLYIHGNLTDGDKSMRVRIAMKG